MDDDRTSNKSSKLVWIRTSVAEAKRVDEDGTLDEKAKENVKVLGTVV